MESDQVKKVILEELSNIAPEIESDEVPADQDMREALELDSMDFLNLVIAVSKRTRVSIPEADYTKVLTLDAMIAYVMRGD